MIEKFIPVCEPMLDGKELEYVTDAVKTGWISSAGKYIDLFEKTFAEFSNQEYAIAVTNGTAALHLALLSAGVSEGDEVIIPSFTMAATGFAVCYIKAVPVIVEVNKSDWTININAVEEAISPRTRAIISVNIFGIPSDLESLKKIARKHNIVLVDDCAEGHGSLLNNKPTSTYADISCYSFYANKNLTTGEGGMVVTNNRAFADQVKYYRNMCFSLDAPRNYQHNDVGYNYRMSNVVAALGAAQVEKADSNIEARVRVGRLYRQYLKHKDVCFQVEESHYKNVYWMNAFYLAENCIKSIQDLATYLKENNVDSRVLFKGMHQQPFILKSAHRLASANYEVTETLSTRGLYIPSGSQLSEDTIKQISQVVLDFLG